MGRLHCYARRSTAEVGQVSSHWCYLTPPDLHTLQGPVCVLIAPVLKIASRRFIATSCPGVLSDDAYHIDVLIFILRVWLPWIPVWVSAVWDMRSIYLDWENRLDVNMQVVARTFALYIAIHMILDAEINKGCTFFWVLGYYGPDAICYADSTFAKSIVITVCTFMYAVGIPLWGRSISRIEARLGTRRKKGVASKKMSGAVGAALSAVDATVKLRLRSATNDAAGSLGFVPASSQAAADEGKAQMRTIDLDGGGSGDWLGGRDSWGATASGDAELSLSPASRRLRTQSSFDSIVRSQVQNRGTGSLQQRL